jgi:hypothetical protein
LRPPECVGRLLRLAGDALPAIYPLAKLARRLSDCLDPDGRDKDFDHRAKNRTVSLRPRPGRLGPTGRRRDRRAGRAAAGHHHQKLDHEPSPVQ